MIRVFLPVIIGGFAAMHLWRDGYRFLAILAGIAAIATFWSHGIMHNYAVENAKRRPSYRGGFSDLTEADIANTPNGPAAVNMASTVGVVVMFVVALFL